jgi:hypothetical protein
MDGHHPADRMIEDAIADGALDGSVTKGKPLPPMRQNNPGWWIQGFLAREKLPEQLNEASAHADAMLERAVAAAALTEARSILADRNRGIIAWNDAVPWDHHLDVIEETDLLTMRQNRGKPAPGPGPRTPN